MDLCLTCCDFENPDHLSSLAEMVNQYIADPMGGGIALSKLKQLRLIDGLANHPTAEVYFAVVDEKVAGMTVCFVNFSTFQVRPYLYIHDIIVGQEYRRKGIGRYLMEQMEIISREREYCKLTLEVREDNATAQTLYRSLGYKETEPTMLFWTKSL